MKKVKGSDAGEEGQCAILPSDAFGRRQSASITPKFDIFRHEQMLRAVCQQISGDED